MTERGHGLPPCFGGSAPPTTIDPDWWHDPVLLGLDVLCANLPAWEASTALSRSLSSIKPRQPGTIDTANPI